MAVTPVPLVRHEERKGDGDGEEKCEDESTPHHDGDETTTATHAMDATPSFGTSGKRKRFAVGRLVSEKTGDEARIDERKADRVKDKKTIALIAHGIAVNRFCKGLSEAHVEALVEEMSYFEFEAGESIVRQGDVGSYFFVSEEGTLDVFVGDKAVNTMQPGSAFGAIALLYNCPRTACVKASKDKPAGVWGCTGDVFRKVIKEHAEKSSKENRKCLDKMALFDGLPAKTKELLGELALVVECHEAKTRILAEDEDAPAVYFVQEGELTYTNGGHYLSGATSCAKFEGGENMGELIVGDCFGWRSVLYDRPQLYNVVAKTDVKLVCVGISQMNEVLGAEIKQTLERGLLLSCVRSVPATASLDRQLQEALAKQCIVQSFEAGQNITKGHLAIGLDGQAIGKDAEGKEHMLWRGKWCQDSLFQSLAPCAPEQDLPQNSVNVKLDDGLAAAKEATWRSGECVVATLSTPGIAAALLEAEYVPSLLGDEDAVAFLRKLLIVMRVPIFRELTPWQLARMVNALAKKEYKKGDTVFKQDDAGDSFYIIATGEVSVIINKKEVARLSDGACFGDRALLLDEGRSATIQIESATANCWSIDRAAFQSVISESMRESLKQHLQMKSKDMGLKMLKHIRLIGKGSFGVVRLVEHKRTGILYALKRIDKIDGKTPDDVTSECKVSKEVQHPFICRLVETFETPASIYLLQELITGGQLYEQVTESKLNLNRKGVQFYIGSICLMLEYLHDKSIVYRDLKPENIMLDSQGYLKLVDFGLAKCLDSGKTFTLVGTIYYIAPEVIRSVGYGYECDIWSMGIMMYELCCGVLPFGDYDYEDQQILEEILDKDVTFPNKYGDGQGKKLMQSLLVKNPTKRLGVAGGGWSNIKEHRFFKAGVTGNLFQSIQGRELQPPLVPEAVSYSDEQALLETCKLDDAHELGEDDPVDAGCRVLVAFKKFDLNQDGHIDREELGMVLNGLDPDTFTEEVVDAVFKMADANGDKNISYEEFVAWVMGDSDGAILAAFKDAVELTFQAY
eukprot:TRINITY_DN18286_c0_g1_i1.p1 TRINITY_DN18286_c0_g1~~TRINITY_DN18286_c0_g1_i1.p1  ORF type:complete len:1024 (+),score=291.07 TRINITY_DN18286_c0_g1_i1:121-3192(+)